MFPGWLALFPFLASNQIKFGAAKRKIRKRPASKASPPFPSISIQLNPRTDREANAARVAGSVAPPGFSGTRGGYGGAEWRRGAGGAQRVRLDAHEQLPLLVRPRHLPLRNRRCLVGFVLPFCLGLPEFEFVCCAAVCLLCCVDSHAVIVSSLFDNCDS